MQQLAQVFVIFTKTSIVSVLGNRHDLVSLMIRPDWLTLLLVAKLHGAQNSFIAIGDRRLVANEGSLNASKI